MFSRPDQQRYNLLYGPFTLDACADRAGYNAHVGKWCCPDFSFLDYDCAGECVWMNPPFANAHVFIEHYLACKARDPMHTSAVIVLPKWRNVKWAKLVEHMTLVHEYPARTMLFTRPSPSNPAEREKVGPAPWPVQVWYCAPSTGVASTSGRTLSASGRTGRAPPAHLPASTPAEGHPQAQTETASLTSMCKSGPPSSSPSSCEEAALDTMSAAAANGNELRELIVIKALANGNPATILVDSGASRDFISRSFVRRHRLDLARGPSLKVRLADGSISTTCDVVPDCALTLGIESKFEDTTDLVVIELDKRFDIILGMPWLKRHNPRIDWPTSTLELPVPAENGAPVTLRGDAADAHRPILTTVTAKRMLKLLCKQPAGLQLFVATLQEIDQALVQHDLQPPPGTPSEISTLLRQRSGIFQEPRGRPPSRPWDHHIELLPGSKPVAPRLLRLSALELQEARRQIQDMLERGWIRPSSSPYGAPVLFAKKPDGSLRMCIDYRALNAQTVRNRYPLPRVDELIDSMHGSAFFSHLDLWSGYHQVRIQDDDIYKTAFRTSFGHYEFAVMPFGLTNAPPTFMAMMNTVLAQHIAAGYIVVYLDDVVIHSKTYEDHLRHIDAVLASLQEHSLHIKLSKCSFARPSTSFLGFKISKDGVSTDPAKIAALANYALPDNITAARAFLGFTGFYRRFIKDYAKIAAPLTDLTKTTKAFPKKLPPAAVHAFNALKTALITAPVLIIPDTSPDATFTLYTDACETGVGAVLLQNRDGVDHPVAYESRKLGPAEYNYPVHEKELLGIIYALIKFRPYLEGCKEFKLFTDHATLRNIYQQPKLSRRQARWLDILAEYQHNMRIIYRRGAVNQADALSRLPSLDPTVPELSLNDFVSVTLVEYCALTNITLPPRKTKIRQSKTSKTRLGGAGVRQHPRQALPGAPQLPPSSTDNAPRPAPPSAPQQQHSSPATPCLAAVAYVLTPDQDLLDTFKTGYDQDPFYADAARPGYVTRADNGLFYVRGRLAVPNVPALRLRLLQDLHDSPHAGHPGYHKTLAAVAQSFWWPRLTRTVKQYVKSCATCQRVKPSHLPPPGLLQPHDTPDRPWKHVSVDLVTDMPPSLSLHGQTCDSIITFVCMLTKQAHFFPCNKTVTAKQLATIFLDAVYRLHLLPSVLVSDRDPRFTSDFWQTLFRHLGTKFNLSTAYHPETDGQTERTHRTIEQILRAYVHPLQDDWASYLPVAEAAYNNSHHSSINTTPFYANYGFHPTTPASVLTPQPAPPSDLAAHLRDIHALVRAEVDYAKARQAEYANRRRRELQFKVGDRVRLDTTHLMLSSELSRKLTDRYIGPFTVTHVISPVAYRLQLPEALKRVHPVFHVSRLLPLTDNDDNLFPGRVQPERPVPTAADYVAGEHTYDVHSLLDVKIDTDPASTARDPEARKRLFFQVFWGPPWDPPCTWEPLRHVAKLDALRDFLCTERWLRFKDSAEYRNFARKNPRMVPKVTTFAEYD